ncbi:MAG: sigma-70 family RNA polymerase sigma factor [Candidatus Kapabacteria bacterium]|nr:sigma-70 family RNA polymerase sigma factor [Candidatus Kapabacteria bacterium]
MEKSLDIKYNQGQEDDKKIIKIILDGNKSAFSLLQKKYKPLITSLIRKMIKNEDDVQDLVQETFIKTYNSLDKYQETYPFSSWLFKLASNHCIDFLRKKRLTTISLQFQNSESDEEQEYEIVDNSNMPDSEILSNERTIIIKEAISQLPDNYQLIIHLRHEEELDYQEISERMNIPLGTVKAHLFRARKILEIYLKKHRYLFREQ